MQGNDGAGLLDAATFVEVARAGSFRGAARLLGVPTSTVSRRIARLEEALGTRLFLRSTRQVRPTDAAQRYLERVAPALAEIARANEEAREREGPLEGLLRVTAPPDVAYGVLAGWVAEFSALHPGVRIEVDVSARIVDLVGEGFDLAFRAARLDASSSLVARKLGPVELWLVVSPGWLEKTRAKLDKPRDLEKVPCVLFRPSGEVQHLPLRRGSETVEVALRGPIAGSDFWFLRACILDGVGPGALPNLVARREVADGTLVRLFSDWCSPALGVHVAHAQGRYLTARARAFRDFALAKMRDGA